MNALARPLGDLGRATLGAFAGVGYAAMLLFEALYYVFAGWRIGQPVRIAAIARQMREIGANALPIVALLGFTVGLMLGIQFIASLSEFGAQSQVVVAVANGMRHR